MRVGDTHAVRSSAPLDGVQVAGESRQIREGLRAAYLAGFSCLFEAFSSRYHVSSDCRSRLSPPLRVSHQAILDDVRLHAVQPPTAQLLRDAELRRRVQPVKP